MSFFVRTAIGIALVVGAVRIFRKDISRIIDALKGPTQTFIKEVKQELDSGALTKIGTDASTQEPAKSAGIGLAAAAAEATKDKHPTELK